MPASHLYPLQRNDARLGLDRLDILVAVRRRIEVNFVVIRGDREVCVVRLRGHDARAEAWAVFPDLPGGVPQALQFSVEARHVYGRVAFGEIERDREYFPGPGDAEIRLEKLDEEAVPGGNQERSVSGLHLEGLSGEFHGLRRAFAAEARNVDAEPFGDGERRRVARDDGAVVQFSGSRTGAGSACAARDSGNERIWSPRGVRSG